MKNTKKDILIAACAAAVALSSVVAVSLVSRSNTLKATEELEQIVVTEAADEIITAPATVEQSPTQQSAPAASEAAAEPVVTSEAIHVNDIAEAPVQEPAQEPAAEAAEPAAAPAEEATPAEAAEEAPPAEEAEAAEEPAAEAPAEAPAETVAPAENTVNEYSQPAPDTETEKSVDIWFEFNGEVDYGSTVTIRSAISGYREPVAYQWQYSPDGERWLNLEDGTDADYIFVVDETNALWSWHLEVTEIG